MLLQCDLPNDYTNRIIIQSYNYELVQSCCIIAQNSSRDSVQRFFAGMKFQRTRSWLDSFFVFDASMGPSPFPRVLFVAIILKGGWPITSSISHVPVGLGHREMT